MANIAELAVQLTAHTAQFSAGMKSAQKDVKGLQQTTAQASPSIGSMLSRMAAPLAGTVTAIGASTYAFNQLWNAAKRVEEIGDLSKTLGTSTQNLQAMERAASRNGIAMETMGGALAKMTERLGDPAQAKAFKQLGLDPKQLRSLDAVAAFGQISDAINKLPTAFDRAAAMQDIFGKGWRAIAEQVQGGSAEIDKAKERLRALGEELGRNDTDAVDNANSAWREFTNTIANFWNKSVANIATFGSKVSNVVSDTGLDKFAKAIWKMGAFQQSGDAFLRLLDRIHGISIAATEAKKPVDDLNAAVQSLADKERKNQETLKGFDKAMRQLWDTGEKGKKVTEEMRTPMEKYSDRLKELNSLSMAGVISQETFARATAIAKDELLSATKAKRNFLEGKFEQTTIGMGIAMLLNQRRGTDLGSMQSRTFADSGNQIERAHLTESQRQTQILMRIDNNTRKPVAVAG